MNVEDAFFVCVNICNAHNVIKLCLVIFSGDLTGGGPDTYRLSVNNAHRVINYIFIMTITHILISELFFTFIHS